jgi:hypothetical protein
MANVLNNQNKQQILALGQLGWSLRRIQAATHVRRETISTYLAAGVGVWPPGGWGRQAGSKPAIGVTTGFGVGLRDARSQNPGRNPSASACEPFQAAIGLGLSRGRNAIWQDLVSEHGFSKLPKRQTLHPQAARLWASASCWRDLHRAGRRGASRLRHGSDDLGVVMRPRMWVFRIQWLVRAALVIFSWVPSWSGKPIKQSTFKPRQFF